MLYDSMRSTLMIISVLIVLSVASFSIAISAEYNSICAVFKNNHLIERNSCNAKILSNTNRDESEPCLREYKWKSGSKTITSKIEEFFQINGQDGETVFTEDGYDLCIKNLSSGNTFCVGGR